MMLVLYLAEHLSHQSANERLPICSLQLSTLVKWKPEILAFFRFLPTRISNGFVEEKTRALMSWERLFEADVEQANAFFLPYGTNPQRYAFHNQVAFLANSAKLHRQLLNTASQDAIYVQDFCPFEHTDVYAHIQHAQGYLSEKEYTLLLRLIGVIEPQYIVPRVLIYRSLSSERLLQRIQERGRKGEQSLDFAFLDALRRQFESWINAWTRSPVIRVDEQINFLADTDAVYKLGAAILEQIKRRELLH